MRKPGLRKKAAVRNLTRRIMVPVLVLLYALTVVIGIGSLIQSEKRIKEKLNGFLADELHRTQYSIDVYLEEMVRTANNLRIDQNVELFFKYGQFSDRQKEQMASFVSSAIRMVPSVYSVYLISSNSDTLMYFGRNSNKILRKEAFYDSDVFQVLRSEKISARDLYPRRVTDTVTGLQLDLLTVYSYNGYSTANGPLVAVVVNTNASVLQAAINAGFSNGACPMLIDKKGMVLTQGGTLPQYMTLADAGIDQSLLDSDRVFPKLEYDRRTYYLVSIPADAFGTRMIHMLPASELSKALEPNRITMLILLVSALLAVTMIWFAFNRFAMKPVTELVQRTLSLEKDVLKEEKSHMQQSLRSIMQHGRMYSEEKRKELAQNARLPFSAEDHVFLVEILIHRYLDLISQMTDREYEALMFGAGNIIEEIMSADTRCVVVNRIANGSFYIIAAPNNLAWDRLQDIIGYSADSLHAILGNALGIKVNILFSLSHVPVCNLWLLAEKSEKAAANRPFFPPGSTIDMDRFEGSDYTDLYRRVSKRVNDYMLAMRAEDFEKANALCDAVFDVSDIYEMRFAWNMMTLTALPMLCAAYPEVVSRETLAMLNHEQTLGRLTSADDMKGWVAACHGKLCESIRAHKSVKSYDLVTRVNDIIDKRFSEPDLNVSYIADAIGVSPNYLSSAYRKLTSFRLTEHIQEVRIAAAREKLLGTDLLVSEIALACGYAYNVSYFQQLFKRKHGMTPSQFREKFKTSPGV